MAALIVEKGVSVVLLNQNSFRSVGALGSLLVLAASSHAVPLPPQKSSSAANVIEQGRKLLESRSARFVENKGQWKLEAKFLAQSRNLNLWYTDHGVRYDHISPNGRRHQAVDMYFLGGHDSRPQGVSKLNAESQYYHGNVSVRGVGSYRELVKRNVLPGVDMRGYFDGGKPRYDLIVAPGTKPSSIAIGFRGANGLSITKGALKVGTNLGGFFNGKPVAYQTVDGHRVPVTAAWTVAQSTARFRIGSYDPRRPLVIDPLVYGTYFGGLQGPDEVRAAVTDNVGGVNRGLFIAGSSASADFPGTSLPFGDTLNPAQGGTDAFVARIVTAGTSTDLSIFIGGSGVDVVQYVKQNPSTGDIWIAGTSVAPGTRDATTGQFNNFPVTTTNIATGSRLIIGDDVAGGSNFFVGRLTHMAGGSLSYGEDNTGTRRYAALFGSGIASASTGSAYITGFDISPKDNNSVQMAFSGVSDSALAPTSGALISNTGNQTDGYAFPRDLNNNPHRAGFLLRFYVDLNSSVPSASAFSVVRQSSQYVTGTRRSELRGVALDSVGQAYVVGTVYQPDRPTSADPLNVDTSAQPTVFYTTTGAIADANGTTVLGRLLRATDVFVRIYGTLGQYTGQPNVRFSGLYGGNGDEEAGGVAMSLSATAGGGSAIPIYTGSAIAIDADANMYFTGTTRASANVPYTAGAFAQFVPPPGNELNNSDVFVARLSTGGGRLDYSTQLGAFAEATTLSYGPAQFTSAMPAGITVDSRGYVYVTGNLRPYSIIWPSTYTSPAVFEPSSWTLSTIPVTRAANTIDTTYDTSAGSKYPTTEGFVVVFNPSFSALQFASYIGGDLDDLVYAPNFDSDGNVIVQGWTDGSRTYSTPNYTTPPEYQDFSGSLPGFISSDAAKSIPDTNNGLLISDFGYNTQRNFPSAFAADQQTIRIAVGRDGYVARVSANLPAAIPPTIGLSFNPSSIQALGTTTGTVTLNAAQPLSTVVTITGPTLVGLSASDIAISGLTQTGPNTYTLRIPSGATSASFTVKSVTVANGGTASFTASIPSGSSTSTSSAGVTIGGLSFSLALNPTTVVGSSAGTSVTGTLSLPTTTGPTISNTAPTNLNFVVTVPNTASNRTIFNVGTSNPFATVDSSDSTKLDIATATIAAGASTGTFSFRVASPTAPTVLIVTASTVANSTVASLTSTASLTVNPVGLVSITPRTTTIRAGRDQLVLTVTFNGPVSSGDAFSLAYSLGGVFPPTTSSSPTLNTTIGALSFVGTSNGQYIYTYTANSNRVSRSQDISIVATYKGTTASTTVTVVR